MRKPPTKEPKDVRKKHFGVKVTDEEHQKIQDKASMFNIKPATLLRNLALDYPVQSKVDQLAFLELKNTRADLGRVGGLLKLLLDKTKFGENEVKYLLAEIEKKQDEVTETARQLLNSISS